MSGEYVAFVTNLESVPGDLVVNRMFEEIRVMTQQLGQTASDLKKLLFYRCEQEPAEEGRTNYGVAMNARVFHASLGILDEACEIFDRVWTDIVGPGAEPQEQPPERLNWGEELGDLTFYMTMAEDALGFTHEQIIQANVAKLGGVRYSGGFTREKSENRDKAAERLAMAAVLNPVLSKTVDR